MKGYIDMPLTKRFKRRSVNLDDLNFRRAQALAQDMGLSVSGTLRILISRAFADYEKQNSLTEMKVW
jgi:macrodomain Ter protein organizer (MatP/YcbG family)